MHVLLKKLQNESLQSRKPQVSKGRIVLNYELKRIGNETRDGNIYCICTEIFEMCYLITLSGANIMMSARMSVDHWSNDADTGKA